MDSSKIIQSIRATLGLSETGSEFADEITTYIGAALAILNQNGVGRVVDLTDETTWGDFKDPLQMIGNKSFQMVPMYVMTKTKIIFDPPPPSNVEFYEKYINELLYRLREAYSMEAM